MYTCEICGKPGSPRQVPEVLMEGGIYQESPAEVIRACYLCVRDGIDHGVIRPQAPIQLTAEDYVQCMSTPAEIDPAPALWVPGQ